MNTLDPTNAVGHAAAMIAVDQGHDTHQRPLTPHQGPVSRWRGLLLDLALTAAGIAAGLGALAAVDHAR